MSRITFTVGPPGAGKTRWSHHEVARRGLEQVHRVNVDDFLTMTHGREFGPLRSPDLNVIRRMLIGIILTIAESGRDVIVDGPNLSTRFSNQVRDELGDLHEYDIQDFTGIPLESCINNDRHRSAKNPWAYAGSDQVTKAWNTGQALRRRFGGAGLPFWVGHLNRSDGIVAYAPEPDLPEAVIVDLDAAIRSGDVRPDHGPSGCLRDGVATLLQQFAHDHGPRIIVLSGQDEDQRDRLIRWLPDKRVRQDELHMRRRGDTRRDGVVKLDLFNDHVRHRFKVIAAFEDSDGLVRIWRRLGLLTCAVRAA
jgi:hypothetical protein